MNFLWLSATENSELCHSLPWLFLESCYTRIAAARITQKTQFYCWNLFTEPLHSNGRGMDTIENSLSIVV
jgi:hypothetical protein